MKEKILNEISNYCNENGCRENCSEDECVLYRIERIVEPDIKEYGIEVEETLQRIVKVKATSEEEAISIVEKQYMREEIVLNEEDFIGYDIHLLIER